MCVCVCVCVCVCRSACLFCSGWHQLSLYLTKGWVVEGKGVSCSVIAPMYGVCKVCVCRVSQLCLHTLKKSSKMPLKSTITEGRSSGH